MTLPTVANTVLKTAGNTAGQTQFKIQLTSCNVGATAKTFFEQGANIDSTTGNLVNGATGGAGNVEIQLLNSDGATPINLLSPTSNTTSATVTANGSGTLTYFARYYATGASTAGAVSAAENYTIVYN